MSLAWFLPLPGSYAGVDVVGVYNFACSLREVLAKHPFLPHGCGLFSGSYFPSFSEGLSLRAKTWCPGVRLPFGFPFLFGGTFIEGLQGVPQDQLERYFPSFSEGLSLRAKTWCPGVRLPFGFPFLFGGTFIEGLQGVPQDQLERYFPSFSEGLSLRASSSVFWSRTSLYFPSFSEGLSLRASSGVSVARRVAISLPFRRDFH